MELVLGRLNNEGEPDDAISCAKVKLENNNANKATANNANSF